MSKNKQARQARQAGLKAAQSSTAGSSTAGRAGHFFGSAVDRTRWPVDISELADRIQAAPSTVSSRDRDLVARMLPLGSVTRRDGSSIRPRMNNPANF